jgi:uncharacterized protein YjbJ (UPF0337 family)
MTRYRPLLVALMLLTGAASLAACDKEAGQKQETVGKLESGVGTIVGDEDLKAEGKKDRMAGNVKQGDLEGAVEDAKK